MNTDSEYLYFLPYQDELLSSWMVRNALTFGIKPSKLSSLCFGNADQWKSDIDSFLSETQTNQLSFKTGISEEIIHKTTFNGSCDYFYSPSGKTPQIKWVMPLGVRAHGNHYASQFCPCCLIEDGDKPYFRKHWRLGFMTCCPYHSIQLHDRCPKCKSPIAIKRVQKRTDKLIFHPEDIVKCSNCGFDLRQSHYQIPPPEELAINLRHFSMYMIGYGHVGNQLFNYSNLYFDGARRLASFLLLKKKGIAMADLILEKNGLKTNLASKYQLKSQLEPEHAEIIHRRRVFTCVYHLMQDWPLSFVSTSKQLDIFKQDLVSGWLDYPFWLNKEISFAVKRDGMPMAAQERESCKRVLELKLNRTVKDYEITKLLVKTFGSAKKSHSHKQIVQAARNAKNSSILLKILHLNESS